MGQIHSAANNGDLQALAQCIIKAPTMIDCTDQNGWTALHWSSYQGHGRLVEYLLGQGASINQQVRGLGATALYLACQQGHMEMVELLAANGADAVARNGEGWTPLMAASFKGHVNIIRYLFDITGGTSGINAVKDDGETALCLACHGGHAEVVRLLLDAGSDPTKARADGMTPMDIAMATGHHDCVLVLEDWQRSYMLIKARHLSRKGHRRASNQTQDSRLLDYVVTDMNDDVFREVMGMMGGCKVQPSGF